MEFGNLFLPATFNVPVTNLFCNFLRPIQFFAFAATQKINYDFTGTFLCAIEFVLFKLHEKNRVWLKLKYTGSAIGLSMMCARLIAELIFVISCFQNLIHF